MKRSILKGLLLIIIIILISTNNVFAAGTNIVLGGDTKVKAGEKGTISVSISSDEDIGVISGTIETNANIESIQCSGKNNWTLTYNSETGAFNAYEANGTKDKEIMTIEYTIKGEATGKANITLKNIEGTTIEYETKSVSDVNYEIEIESTIVEEPGEDEDDKNEVTESPEINEENKEENDVQKETEDKENVTNNKIVVENKENTTSKNQLPKTGIGFGVVVLIVIFSIISFISLKKYNKLNI